ncbi:response regulator [Desulfococcaceae bacterium HSG7]|nr:response regulator [Desulfococcaceae bacterium HSG9]MDM8553235.1 response regulator [Desulfococcaceae bacterium HSG7]
MFENKKLEQSDILAVDDNPDNLRLLADILKKMNFKVRPAKDGQTALKSAISNPPDLILMDILMPGMDGYETCAHIKADDRTREIPVIFVSALDASLDKVKAFKVGGVDYVSKPFNEEELLARITTHLSLRNMQKSLAEKNACLQSEIIERKRAEKIIKESEKRFATVMNSMEAVMYVADMETYQLLFVNQYTRDTFGASEGDICWRLLQANQNGPCDFCTNKHLIKNGEPVGVYSWEFHNTLTGHWYQIRDRAIYWPDGRLVRMEIATDIDKLKQTEEILKAAKKAAESANQAKSAFLAGMSHELRTPLNGILGFAQILSRDSSITDQQRHGLDVIKQSGNHLLSLISDLLDLAKVESGKTELYETDFNLPSLLIGVSEIINIRAQNKGIGFYSESADDLPDSVHGDERRLRQILLNLLGNAVKFTDQGRVALKVSVKESEHTDSPLICFRIEDTGIGISPKDIESIFNPFEQVGDKKRQIRGTGLGLSISQKLVELMRGRLEVSSQMNVGTQFWFELPLPIIDYYIAPINGQPIIGVQGNVPKILIVDDNASSRDVLADLLAPLGFHIELAEDGLEGLAKALKWLPDVIITDLAMPKSDGYELIRQLRQSSVLKKKIIIVVSANVHEANKSIAIGSDAFLPKPVRIETLLEQLQRHLNLTWIYEDKTKETVTEGSISLPMVFPPASELKKLYELSMMADIYELEERTAILDDTDAKYKPFVTKMRAFLKQYRMEEVSKWLEREITNDR